MIDVRPDESLSWAPVGASSAGSSSPTPQPPAGNRRRAWVVLGGVGAIIALVVAANVVTSPDDRPRAAPTTQASASPTTVAPTRSTSPSTAADTAVGTTDAVPTTPTVVADPPPGYRVVHAERYLSGIGGESDGQLWTTWSADAQSASWVSITAWPADTGWRSTGSSRVWLTSGVGVLNRATDATVTLDAERDEHHVTIQARGLDTPSLAAVFDSLSFPDDRLGDVPALSALGLHLLATSSPTDTDARQTEVLSIGFASTADPQQWIYVTVGQPMTSFDRAMRTFRMRQPTAMAVGTHLATFGLDGRFTDQEQPIAIVDVDGTEVELLGGASVQELITLARTLRTGTDDDWKALVETVQAPTDSTTGGSELKIAEGRMRTGASWVASAIVGDPRSPFGDQPMVGVQLSAASVSGDGREPDSYGNWVPTAGDAPVIQAVASADGVVLLGRVGADHPAAELRVTVADTAYHAAVVSPGVEAPGLWAAVGFSELAAYHAELIDPDGTVLATLDDT